MTWTVEDCAILLQTIAGHDPNDPASSTRPLPDYRAALTGNIKGMRIGVVRHLHEAGACSLENNRAALRSHLDQLRTRSLVGPWEYWRRGWLHTQAGRWPEAAGDFLQALRSPQWILDSGLSAESGQGP